jgi:hypothetical protein
VPDLEYHMATDQIDFDDDTKLVDIFFKHIFPSIEGHAKKLDKYLADPKAEFYETVIHDKITFHDEDAEDPDWKIRQAYTLLIAAASKIENGVGNLWKRGKGMGWRDYPDFGRFMSKNAFKAFKYGAHLCWTEE